MSSSVIRSQEQHKVFVASVSFSFILSGLLGMAQFMGDRSRGSLPLLGASVPRSLRGDEVGLPWGGEQRTTTGRRIDGRQGTSRICIDATSRPIPVDFVAPRACDRAPS
ncbi:hypothetical protein N7532_007317 [Penicillium argentinense]|uniref:Uncharacterized protein n=1 Tax=Penicillium argentinense TaxID=1131581 RepID=A0A9W9K770_9EURO|nr:uncharacterized protein N7532_007317 [Penicillium argentinense]KAJ5095026.1 hypothetical protein N7532_007317 [Penicillium argentinense]